MALTLYEFNALPIGERAEVLWAHGTYLVATDHLRGRSAFYAFADFWVEVLMVGKEQRIAEVVPFFFGPRLDRCLSIIDLAKL